MTRMPAPNTRGDIREYRTTLDDLVRDITGEVTTAALTESDVPCVEESLVPAQSALRDATLNLAIGTAAAGGRAVALGCDGAKAG